MPNRYIVFTNLSLIIGLKITLVTYKITSAKLNKDPNVYTYDWCIGVVDIVFL